MKTIVGRSVSLKDISLSEAAEILSKFASADNGASPAINSYLRRASAAFYELKNMHKELKVQVSKHKHLKKGSETPNDEGTAELGNGEAAKARGITRQNDSEFGEEPTNSVEDSTVVENGISKHKGKKKKRNNDENGYVADDGRECGNEEVIKEGRKKRKKDVQEATADGSIGPNNKKKARR